jgi:hypothetical protein
MVGAIPPQEQRNADYERLKARYAGAEPSGDVMLLYGQNKDTVPVITPMPYNASDERFKDLILSVNQNILIGHGANSNVAGIETAGKLGAANEIQDSYTMFQNTIINGAQKMIEDTITKLASYNGIVAEFELERYNLLNPENDDNEQPIEPEEIK